MQYGCVWFHVEGAGMTYCDVIMQVHIEDECQKTTGEAGLSRSGGAQPSSVMDEE